MSGSRKCITHLACFVAVLCLRTGRLGAEEAENATGRGIVKITGEDRQISITRGSSVILSSGLAIPRVTVAHPEIVSVNALQKNQVLVVAKETGVTSASVWDEDSNRTTVKITVKDDDDVVQPLRDKIKEVFPDARISLHDLPMGVVISGQINQTHISALIKIAESYFPNVINNVSAISDPAGFESRRDATDSTHPLGGKLKEIYPDLNIGIVEFPNGVLVRGVVETRQQLNAIARMAGLYVPKVINELTLSGTVQGTPIGLPGPPVNPGNVTSPNARPSDPAASSVQNGVSVSQPQYGYPVRSRKPGAEPRDRTLREIHSEVRGLRRDVRRLIDLLEEKATQSPNSSATGEHQTQTGNEERVSEKTSLSARFQRLKRWELSPQEAVMLALCKFELGDVIYDYRSDGGWTIGVKRKEPNVASDVVLKSAMEHVADAQQAYAGLATSLEALDEAKLQMENQAAVWHWLRDSASDSTAEKDARDKFFQRRSDVEASIRKTLQHEGALRWLLGMEEAEGRLIVPPTAMRGVLAEQPEPPQKPTIVVPPDQPGQGFNATSRRGDARSINFVAQVPDRSIAQKIVETAEALRQQLANDWFGSELPNWTKPCMINALVSDKLGTGGSTSFTYHDGKATGFEMKIQGSQDALAGQLEHEVMHTVLASFTNGPLPRWLDEGVCLYVAGYSQTELDALRERFSDSQRMIPLAQLFEADEYPADILPFYVQSQGVVAHLVRTRGQPSFAAFLSDVAETGQWKSPLLSHFELESVDQLQQEWALARDRSYR